MQANQLCTNLHINLWLVNRISENDHKSFKSHLLAEKNLFMVIIFQSRNAGTWKFDEVLKGSVWSWEVHCFYLSLAALCSWYKVQSKWLKIKVEHCQLLVTCLYTFFVFFFCFFNLACFVFCASKWVMFVAWPTRTPAVIFRRMYANNERKAENIVMMYTESFKIGLKA